MTACGFYTMQCTRLDLQPAPPDTIPTSYHVAKDTATCCCLCACSLHSGVVGMPGRQLLCTQGRGLGVRQGWMLVSEGLQLKYSCLLALPLVAALRQAGQVVLRGGSLITSLRAMAAHNSQWVW